MNWINLPVSTLDSPAVIGADPVERGTWLMLLRYCAGQENGGVIENCALWPDRRWQQTCRVTFDEVKTPSELWEWEGENLRLHLYPAEREAHLKHLRKAGSATSEAKAETARANGSAGGRPPNKPNKPNKNPTRKPNKNRTKTQHGNRTKTQQKTERETQRKGKERKGIGKEDKEEAAVAALAAAAPSGLSVSPETHCASAYVLTAAAPRAEQTQPALAAAEAAMRRHPSLDILALTRAIAAAIRHWPQEERDQFAPSTVRFFAEDQFLRPLDQWKSRRTAAPPAVDCGDRRFTVLEIPAT